NDWLRQDDRLRPPGRGNAALLLVRPASLFAVRRHHDHRPEIRLEILSRLGPLGERGLPHHRQLHDDLRLDDGGVQAPSLPTGPVGIGQPLLLVAAFGRRVQSALAAHRQAALLGENGAWPHQRQRCTPQPSLGGAPGVGREPIWLAGCSGWPSPFPTWGWPTWPTAPGG